MAIATVPSVTDPRELALLKAVGLDRVGPEQRELALNIAQRYELDLMLKHLVLIDGRPYITRDGLLHVAHRDGALDGIVTTEPVLIDGYWRSTCSVYRKDMKYPFTYTGRYPSQGGREVNVKFAPEMAVKVGEVMALRRAFDVAAPVAEERWDTEVPTVQVERPPTLAEKAAAKRAEIAAPEAAQATETAADAEAEAMGAPAVDEAPTGGMSSADLSEKARAAGVGKMALAAALEVVPEDVAKRIIAMTDAERYELAQRLGIVS